MKKLEILSDGDKNISRKDFLKGLVIISVFPLLENCSTYSYKKTRLKKIKSIYSRGLNKEYIKKFMGLDLEKKSKDNKNKEYFKEVEKYESNIIITPRTPCDVEDLKGNNKEIHNKINNLTKLFEAECEGIEALERMYSATMENMKTIRAVDSVSINQLEPKHESLKILLNELHEIDLGKMNPYKKLENTYNSISERIGNREKRIETIYPAKIIEIIGSGIGNCDDLSAVYFSLFNYFNIPCCFKIGQLWRNGVKKDLHAWNSADVEEQKIDFDGTWYEKFAPLKNTNFERITFKEKFMLDKSHKLNL